MEQVKPLAGHLRCRNCLSHAGGDAMIVVVVISAGERARHTAQASGTGTLLLIFHNVHAAFSL